MNNLARVEEIFRDRGKRARELKAEGKPIIGYLCTFAPIEIMHAAGVMPFRIAGSMREPITEAGQYLEVIACPFTRSILDLALKGDYAFLDGFVAPHACDNIVKLYDLWACNVEHAFAHFVNVPHTQSGPSFKFFEAELRTFQTALERFTGRDVYPEDMDKSIQLYNQQRSLVHRLYEFRKSSPPAVSGAEITKTLVAVMSLPVEEANDLLEGVIAEVEVRGSAEAFAKGPRVMIYGTGNEDTVFIDLIESLGASVVTDDLCFGTRAFWHEVDSEGDPVARIASSYLQKITCPRTYRQNPGSHEADLENRFGHIHELATEYGADGIICFILRYCDTHAFDLPDLREYMEQKQIPVLVVEEEYPVASSLDRLKTRLETFLEIIAG